MKTLSRPSGVRIEVANHVAVMGIASIDAGREDVDNDVPRGASAGGRVYDTMTLDRSSVAGGDMDDSIVSAMERQDMKLVDSVVFSVPDRAEVRRLPAESISAPTISIDVSLDEEAAVLFEKDGIYSWGVSEDRRLNINAARGFELSSASLTIRFTIPFYLTSVGESAADRRFPEFGISVDRVRAYVFKFLVVAAVNRLERGGQKQLIVMDSIDPEKWKAVDNLSDLVPPDDHAPTILLFIHGTFSSTVGSFGALGATEYGRAFLQDSRDNYDVVIGYDHPTLSEDPRDNANDLLARLTRADGLPAAQIDAVAFSRGGLVLRCLNEDLLASRPHIARIQRALFVGSTNAGTLLARTENWRELIDLYTNLVVAGCAIVRLFGVTSIATTIFEQSLKSLGALIKALASQATAEVVGLAAMNPDGELVQHLNEARAVDTHATAAKYFTVTSDFDVSLADVSGVHSMPRTLVRWLINRGVDRLMHEANDLVVNTASMSAGDSWATRFMMPSHAFGKNPIVYHTVYFLQKETVDSMSRSFEMLRIPQPSMHRRGSIASTLGKHASSGRYIETSIVVVDSDAEIHHACERMEQVGAKWVVVRRADVPSEERSTYLYAFTAEEISEVAQLVEPATELRIALQSVSELELHEAGRSSQMENGVLLPGEECGLTGKRTIETVAGDPVGVYDFRIAALETQLVKQLDEADLAGHDKIRGSISKLNIESISHPNLQVAGVDSESVDADSLSTEFRRVSSDSNDDAAFDFDALSYSEIESDSGSTGSHDEAPMYAEGPSLDSGSHDGSEVSLGDGPWLTDVLDVNSADLQPTPVLPPEEPREICHIAASMPAEVRAGDTADIFVDLSLDDFVPRDRGVVGLAKGEIELTEAIDVFVQGKRNFARIANDDAHVVLTATTRSAHLIFQTQAVADGEGEIWVVAMQCGRTIGTVILKPRVVSTLVAKRRTLRNGVTAFPPEDLTAVTPVMQIFENIKGANEWELLFILQMPDGSFLKYRSKEIKGDRQAYVQQVYKEIETQWTDSNDAQEAFERNLVGYGSKLLEALVPTQVQAALWENRETLTGIQVVSEEPFLPWELVYLNAPPSQTGVNSASSQPGMFFAELGLVRWLHNYPPPPSQFSVREGKASYIIPEYAPKQWKLDAAQAEKLFLATELRAQEEAASAANALKVLARTDDIDLFHFSGHGIVPDNAADDAVMTMRGFVHDGDKYTPEYLSAATVKANPPLSSSRKRRPWVTLNACQLGRMTMQLQSVGGFAPAFLHIGAGVFVAALWSVRDEPARVFSEALYRAFFLDGVPLAEAVTHARRQARALAQDTWLSYAVYGKPTARGMREWASQATSSTT
jgi:hypothetical protein